MSYYSYGLGFTAAESAVTITGVKPAAVIDEENAAQRQLQEAQSEYQRALTQSGGQPLPGAANANFLAICRSNNGQMLPDGGCLLREPDGKQTVIRLVPDGNSFRFTKTPYTGQGAGGPQGPSQPMSTTTKAAIGAGAALLALRFLL